MKFSVAFLAIIVAPFCFAAAPSIKIGPVTLGLAYAPGDSPIGLREYVPAGETLQNWTKMASVRVFIKEKKPTEYLNRVGQQVMGSHPAAKAVLFKNDKTGDHVLDFLTFTPDSTVAEWNLMRAKYDKKKGLIVFQYAARFRTDENLAAAIVAERERMFQSFGDATFEEEANQSPQPTPGS
jgi:hypothetical protein